MSWQVTGARLEKDKGSGAFFLYLVILMERPTVGLSGVFRFGG